MLLLWIVTLPAIAENTILIVGDSLSTSYGMRLQQGWVALLQKRLKDNGYQNRVVNISETGATTSNGLARLPAALDKYKPAIVIIELGGNDGLRGLPLSVIQNNLNRMVSVALTTGSKVLLLGVRLPPNYGPEYTSKFEAIFSEVARENKVSVVPLMLKGMDEDRAMFQEDGIHPTAEAQSTILSNVWTELEALLSR